MGQLFSLIKRKSLKQKQKIPKVEVLRPVKQNIKFSNYKNVQDFIYFYYNIKKLNNLTNFKIKISYPSFTHVYDVYLQKSKSKRITTEDGDLVEYDFDLDFLQNTRLLIRTKNHKLFNLIIIIQQDLL